MNHALWNEIIERTVEMNELIARTKELDKRFDALDVRVKELIWDLPIDAGKEGAE